MKIFVTIDNPRDCACHRTFEKEARFNMADERLDG